jgi:glycosyltransferase involved in cell wall biosynthesis
MPTVLHISADFPDALGSQKTRAIRNLIEAAPGFRHVVYSLNRVNGLGHISSAPFGEDRIAVAYGAPPKGLMLAAYLDRLRDWIAADLQRRGLVPDVVHAHKLSVEGLVGLGLVEDADTRLLVSIQGDSDTKITRVRPDLWGRWRKVVRRADALVSMSPWPLAQLRAILGEDAARCRILPAMTRAETLSPSAPTGQPQLAALFHLAPWKRKGADTIARAARLAARTYPDLRIDLYGDGAGAELVQVKAMLSRLDPLQRVRLMGPIEHGDVQATLSKYAGFIMPSRRETYGLAYVEALFAGVPLVYSRGRGIDGLLPESLIGYGCDPGSPADVAAGIVHVIRNEAPLKKGIARAQADHLLDPLRGEFIGRTYVEILTTLAG